MANVCNAPGFVYPCLQKKVTNIQQYAFCKPGWFPTFRGGFINLAMNAQSKVVSRGPSTSAGSATSTPPSALPTVDQQLKDWKAIAECKSKKNAEVLKILRKRATQSHEDQKIRLNTAFNLKVRTRATRRTEP